MVDRPLLTPAAARSRVGNGTIQKLPPDVLADLRRDLAAANVAAAMSRFLPVAPPLHESQIDALIAHLRAGGKR